MKSSRWLILTELKQNRLHFALILVASLIFGRALRFGYQAEQRIASLAVKQDWAADLAVIPKGMTLEDLRQEMLTGQVHALLPEAIFDTTSDMAKGQFKLGAVLATRDEKGPVILKRGEDLGLKWLPPQSRVEGWREQSREGTAEWGKKVISAFFASGPQVMMKSLKDLIDRRTVAQAIWIEQQQQRDEKMQNELKASVVEAEIMFSVLVLALLISSVAWLRNRLENGFAVYEELGLPNSLKLQLLATFFVGLVLIPISLGWMSFG